VDESLGDEVRVTVIATGFAEGNKQQSLPSLDRPTTQRDRGGRTNGAPAQTSRNTTSNGGAFDIPEFLRNSRL
jgi:cell division protein FtsZ